jgi:hypothetical protein
MTAHKLAHSIYSPLFGERDSIEEAYKYITAMAQNSDEPIAMLTAVHVMMNTIAKQIEKMEQGETA